MTIPNDLFNASFMNSTVALAAIVILAFYWRLSVKIRSLPKIPLGLFIVFFVLRLIYLSLPASLDERFFRWVNVFGTIAINCALVRLVFAIAVDGIAKLRGRPAVPKITRDFILMAAYSIIILVVLRTHGGVNLAGLITTSAVLTAVLGLAAQNSLGNLFAGLSIQLEKPYRIGDWVQYENYSGQVVGISWKSTRLKTFDEEMIFIPNLDMSQKIIKNFSMPTTRVAMKIDVGVEYGVPPDRVRKVLLGVLRQEPEVLPEPKPVVRVTNYGDFAVTYQMRFFYHDYGKAPDLRATIMNRVWYALRRHDIKIPFPVRDIHHRHIERKYDAEKSALIRGKALAELEGVPILAPLSPEDRASIAARMTIEEYSDGEAIVWQGDAGDSIYVIHSGTCDVEVATAGGTPAVVATMTSPSFFGEMSLLTGEPRSATIRAKGETTVYSIDKPLFKEFLAARPEITDGLVRALIERQAETAGVVERAGEEKERQASTLLGKIKSFFGLA